MISPSCTYLIGPSSAASGETCPIEAPLDAPEKRPSVIRATLEPSPIPAIADVGDNVSDEEFAKRKAAYVAKEEKPVSGYLARYRHLVTSGAKGAVMKRPEELGK